MEKPKHSGDTSRLYSPYLCPCPEIVQSGVPQCSCQDDTGISPLLRIRWKRLVIDEGHVASSKTDLTFMCGIISAERRWLVTGTPTTNLLGLELGRTSEMHQAIEPSLQNVIHDLKAAAATDDDTSVADAHCWSKFYREDLNKLSTMLRVFLGIPGFKQIEEFRAQVIEPLLYSDGPSLGAVQVLTQVMESVMIRHRFVRVYIIGS